MKYLHLFLGFLAGPVSAQPAAPQVKVNIEWEYKGFSGPIALYEVKGRPRLWATQSVASLEAAPLGKPIEGSMLSMNPGQYKRFALVFQNSTDSAIHFFAAPHVVHPVEHSLGFKFKCLCINHAFKAGPKETWYRIVEFQLSREFVGQELSVTHTVIGIDKDRAAPFSKAPAQPDP